MNTKILGITAVFLILIGSVFAVTNMESTETEAQEFNGMRRNAPLISEELMTQINSAINAGDYDLWLSLHEENNLPARENITAENFHLLKEMREYQEKINEIREELGFPEKGKTGNGFEKEMNGFGKGMHNGFRKKMNAENNCVQEAVSNQ
ncbi:MAG: hypothetical protein JW703_04460 [Candidatus Diapherotrites archaeon]|nr:hypothetical protein [Candidatus Diapherotrites archaeon]